MPSLYRSKIESSIKKIQMSKAQAFVRAGISEEFAIDLLGISEILSAKRAGREKCNIIGSGMSALAAIDDGQDVNAAYFTCNFGGILPLSYDLYLIEVASHKRLEISELQRDLIYEIGERSGRVFLKNLWEGKISSYYYSNNYKGVNIIYDSLFPGMTEILESGETDFIFDIFFFRNLEVMLQVYTTPLTLLQLAVRAGYKDIKIFGLDGRGSHFFHSPDAQFDSSVLQRARELIPKVAESYPHKVGYPARKILPIMIDYLYRKGVRVDLVGMK